MSQAQTPDTNSWIDKRTGNDDNEEDEDDSANSSKEDEEDKKEEEEMPNYYQPNDSYKAVNTSSENTPVYDGSKSKTTEQVPLSERTVTPVLPKTGSSGRLF